MAYYYPEPSHTFSEYLLIPGYTGEDCVPQNVTLRTALIGEAAGTTLRYILRDAEGKTVAVIKWKTLSKAI